MLSEVRTRGWVSCDAVDSKLESHGTRGVASDQAATRFIMENDDQYNEKTDAKLIHSWIVYEAEGTS